MSSQCPLVLECPLVVVYSRAGFLPPGAPIPLQLSRFGSINKAFWEGISNLSFQVGSQRERVWTTWSKVLSRFQRFLQGSLWLHSNIVLTGYVLYCQLKQFSKFGDILSTFKVRNFNLENFVKMQDSEWQYWPVSKVLSSGRQVYQGGRCCKFPN